MRNTLVLLLPLAACATRPPVGSFVSLPRDTAQECTNVSGNPPPGGSSAASAGAIIVVEEEEAAQQQHVQQRHQDPTHH